MTTGPKLAVLLLLTGYVAADWTISGQYQYLISNDKVYRENGFSFCTQNKPTAFLARPTNENAEFLKSFGSETMYWADHQYDGTKGWVWSDGSSLPVGDIHWHSPYPKDPLANSIGIYERASATLMNTEPNYYQFPVVCQAPLDTPEPTTIAPEPTTTAPEPTTTAPEPTTTEPEPTTTAPGPTTTAPGPTTTAPEPTTTAPEPTTTAPGPTTTAPGSTTTAPGPTSSTPEPTSAATTASPAPCPSGDGWVDLGTGDGRCYYLSTSDPAAATTKLSWSEASQACADMGAELAVVPDRPNFYALSFRVRSAGEDAWTGLLNIPVVGLSWADGSEFNADLQQFVVNGTGPDDSGYLSHADGNFHLTDSADTKAFICSTDAPTPASSTPAPTPSPCPSGWEQFNDTCYLFSDEQQMWTTAAHRCFEVGADLVSIHDEDLIPFLLLKADEDVYWTGLQDGDGVYVWQDGSSTADIALLEPYLDDWAQGKDCVAMDKSLFPDPTLVHENCFAERRFVCQKHAV